MRRRKPREDLPPPSGTAMDLIDDSRVKKLKRYQSRWTVDAGDLIADGEIVGKIDESHSRYFFKNRKWGQLFYAYVDSKFHVFRECNRVGYVAPTKYTLSRMPVVIDLEDDDGQD